MKKIDSPYSMKQIIESYKCKTCEAIFTDTNELHQHVIDTDHSEFIENRVRILMVDKTKLIE